MKKGDIIWLAALAVVVLLLVWPVTHEQVVNGTRQHPLIAGFIKFFILASMGDLLSMRIVSGQWQKPVGFVYRAIVWGIIGTTIAVFFEVNGKGVAAAISAGVLPISHGNLDKIIAAFWVSLIMNATAGPMTLIFHRFTDTFFDLAEGKFSNFGSVSAKMVVRHIDWQEFMCFVFKVQMFLWLPVHTVVFLLPPVYRVLAAAALSVILGAVLGYGKRRSNMAKNQTAA
ncbi:MAG: hypothetical protein H6Q65_982 [Firmicutes bacterium]|nr:hypothetical protein [Bacillota bacterium]